MVDHAHGGGVEQLTTRDWYAKLAEENDCLLLLDVQIGYSTIADEVATAGGLLGKVSKIGDTFINLEISNGVEVQLQRSAVVQVLPKGTLKS